MYPDGPSSTVLSSTAPLKVASLASASLTEYWLRGSIRSRSSSCPASWSAVETRARTVYSTDQAPNASCWTNGSAGYTSTHGGVGFEISSLDTWMPGITGSSSAWSCAQIASMIWLSVDV